MSKQSATLLHNARREAIVVLTILFVAIVWTVGVSYGYSEFRPAEQMQFFLGLPDWIIVGVLAPWMLSTVATIWFGFRFMKDDELGVDQPEASDAQG